MGESSGEIKGLIVAITFLSTFFIITALIPSGFLYTASEGRTVEVPEYFESVDIYSFADTYNFTVANESSVEDFDLGGWHVRFHNDFEAEDFYVQLRDIWWIFTYNFRALDWYNNKGIRVSDALHDLDYAELDKNYDSEHNVCKFTVKNKETTFIVFFGFNTTKYSKPTEALADGDLHCLFCINFDKQNTSVNAWNLVGAILFFQMPDVHPAINALIAIPLWVMIAYLVYVLILKAIPFVGG